MLPCFQVNALFPEYPFSARIHLLYQLLMQANLAIQKH
jgi:hypothetical protein